jgi:hypothetical protein
LAAELMKNRFAFARQWSTDPRLSPLIRGKKYFVRQITARPACRQIMKQLLLAPVLDPFRPV